MRRGWLGVRIQQVTDDIAESLGLKPVRGALVAGVDDKGPAKPAGIEAGDVIVKFDGKDIKEMRDLPKIVGDTPVGKDVPVIVIRKGKEETKTVRLGRLEDTPQPASVKTDAPAEDKSVVQKALGLNLAGMTDELRKQYKIKDGVKGVVITGVDANSAAAEKRLNAGDVIVKVTDEEVANAGRRAKAHRPAQEGRQEDRAAAGRERRRRRALRGADAAVVFAYDGLGGRAGRVTPALSRSVGAMAHARDAYLSDVSDERSDESHPRRQRDRRERRHRFGARLRLFPAFGRAHGVAGDVAPHAEGSGMSARRAVLRRRGRGQAPSAQRMDLRGAAARAWRPSRTASASGKT